MSRSARIWPSGEPVVIKRSDPGRVVILGTVRSGSINTVFVDGTVKERSPDAVEMVCSCMAIELPPVVLNRYVVPEAILKFSPVDPEVLLKVSALFLEVTVVASK